MATTTTNLYPTTDAARPVPQKQVVYKVVDGQLIPMEGALGDPSPDARRMLRVDYAPLSSDTAEKVNRTKTAYACMLDVLFEMRASLGKQHDGRPDLDRAIEHLITSSMWATRGLT